MRAFYRECVCFVLTCAYTTDYSVKLDKAKTVYLTEKQKKIKKTYADWSVFSYIIHYWHGNNTRRYAETFCMERQATNVLLQLTRFLS